MTSFVLGLLTPLGAVCVLPLFPGFLAYLSSQVSKKSNKTSLMMFGVIISAGVIFFMVLIGLVFTTFLEISLTNVIGVVSPVAFTILAVISVLLIVDVDFSKYIPKISAPVTKNPFASAFIYGFFFGAIVVPCNPLFIAVLFTKATTTIGFVTNMINFLLFGMGLSFPLLAFSVISSASSKTVISFLTKYKKPINQAAGLIMLPISLYYLIFVFHVLG